MAYRKIVNYLLLLNFIFIAMILVKIFRPKWKKKELFQESMKNCTLFTIFILIVIIMNKSGKKDTDESGKNRELFQESSIYFFT